MFRTTGQIPVPQILNAAGLLLNSPKTPAKKGKPPLFHKLHSPYYFFCKKI